MARSTHLGNLLKEKRIKKGLTQAGMAHSLGDMHPQFISNWERGLCAPPSDRLLEIIKLLDLSPNKVVSIMLEDSREEIESKLFKKKTKNAARPFLSSGNPGKKKSKR